MAGKKLPKNIDFAAGFFSNSIEDSPTELRSEKITAPTIVSNEQKEVKNLGGRPKKEGLKNEQFSLTMNPETYEKLRIIAKEQTRGNFSALINEAIKAYCKQEKIDLSSIKVEPEILDIYKQKQAKKTKRK